MNYTVTVHNGLQTVKNKLQQIGDQMMSTIPNLNQAEGNLAESQVARKVMDREWTVGKGCCLASESWQNVQRALEQISFLSMDI